MIALEFGGIQLYVSFCVFLLVVGFFFCVYVDYFKKVHKVLDLKEVEGIYLCQECDECIVDDFFLYALERTVVCAYVHACVVKGN